MSGVEFRNEEKTVITQKLRRYLTAEIVANIGRFDVEFLLDFISEELGFYFCNRGLYDAQTLLNARFEDMADAIVALEKFEADRRF